METRLGKVLHFGRPASLLVLLLLFLVLPSVAVSCSSDGSGGPGEFSAELSGLELVLGDQPALETSGAFDGGYTEDSLVAGSVQRAGAEPLVRKFVGCAIAVLVIGMAVSFLPLWRWRAALTATAAAGAAVLLVVADTMMLDKWQDMLVGYAGLMSQLPEAQGVDLAAELAAAVRLGSGFWLTVVGLAVVAVASLAPFVRRRPEPMEPEPPVSD